MGDHAYHRATVLPSCVILVRWICHNKDFEPLQEKKEIKFSGFQIKSYINENRRESWYFYFCYLCQIQVRKHSDLEQFSQQNGRGKVGPGSSWSFFFLALSFQLFNLKKNLDILLLTLTCLCFSFFLASVILYSPLLNFCNHNNLSNIQNNMFSWTFLVPGECVFDYHARVSETYDSDIKTSNVLLLPNAVTVNNFYCVLF